MDSWYPAFHCRAISTSWPFLGLVERRDLAEERLLRRVEVLDEVDDPAVVLEGRLGHGIGALVDEADLEALVQEGHDLHALDDRLGPELGLVEDRCVRPEGDRRACTRLTGAAVLRSRARRRDLALDLPALLELGLPVLAVPVHLEHQPGGEGVHDRDPDAVQATRDLVPLAAELAAGVQGGQDDLGRRDLGVLLVGAHGDPGRRRRPTRQPPSASRVTSIRVAAASHGLVDRVVHDLPHQVVEARRAGGADVHPGPLPHGLETLEDGDVGLGVRRPGPT